MPATSASLPRLLFLLWALTVLMKQTRQAVFAVKHFILLDVYTYIPDKQIGAVTFMSMIPTILML